jgi:hypothetical protein
MKKELERFTRWFATLAKDCGVLKFKGREMRITSVTPDAFVVQDVYGLKPAFSVPRNSTEVTDVGLRRSFQMQT